MPNRKQLSFKVLRRFWAMPCVICGSTYKINVDHIIPVSRGGTNDESNLQPLCWPCNAKKGSKHDNEWMRAWYARNKKFIDPLRKWQEAHIYQNPYDPPLYAYPHHPRLV